MPVLPKCSNCKRLNGYADSGKDKVCARCKKTNKEAEKENEEDK